VPGNRHISFIDWQGVPPQGYCGDLRGLVVEMKPKSAIGKRSAKSDSQYAERLLGAENNPTQALPDLASHP